MTDTIKVLEPTVVPDAKFPIDGNNVLSNSGSSGTGKAFGTETIADTPMPVKKTSRELLSTAFNTKSKKILQEFQFTPSGALQIGEYTNGVTGDIRISPTGILARDSLGDTTFAIDAETGDAIFKGTVRAGSLISDGIIEGGSININDTFIVDSSGNVTANSIILASSNSASLTGGSQTFTTNSDVELTGSSMSVTFTRNTKVLIMFHGSYFYVEGSSGVTWAGRMKLKIQVDGSNIAQSFTQGGGNGTNSYDNYNTSLSPASMNVVASMAAGSHTIRVVGYIDSVSGTAHFTVQEFLFSYITLGNY